LRGEVDEAPGLTQPAGGAFDQLAGKDERLVAGRRTVAERQRDKANRQDAEQPGTQEDGPAQIELIPVHPEGYFVKLGKQGAHRWRRVRRRINPEVQGRVQQAAPLR
jgi:hypothetical protein